MISKNVIMAVLTAVAVTGVIPVIAGLVLLAIHKIKASSFWAGVLAYIIASIAYTIVGGILSGIVMASSGNMNDVLSAASEPPAGLTVILSVIMGVAIALSMGICIGSCMKKTRTFVGAVSCGLGYGISSLVVSAVSFASFYITSVSINNGTFDKSYEQLVRMGAIDKEMVNSMKEVYTSLTVTDALTQTVAALGTAALMAAAAVFIMRAVCARKLFAGVGVSLLLLAVQMGVPGLLSNAVAGTVIAAAIGAAALIFALRMREGIVPPPKPSYAADSFMQSVESVKNDTTETK